MKSILKKVTNKLKETRGNGFLISAVILVAMLMIFSVVVEYFRITITARGIRDAYEKAIVSVATENYNDVFSASREENISGGIYEGGGEGEWSPVEEPGWTELKDYGDVEEELINLLELAESEGRLVKKSSNDKIQYELYGFSEEIKNKNESNRNKYEVKGNATLKIPIYFSGVMVTKVELPICVTSAYTEKY